MRKLLAQGLPEAIFFIIVLYFLLYLRALLPEVESLEISPAPFMLSALIFFLMGFAPGCPGLVHRVKREGLGLNLRLLLLPGMAILYVVLLPYLLETHSLNLPELGLGRGLLFASRAAAVWFGFLFSRSVSREPDRPVSYLRPPYQY